MSECFDCIGDVRFCLALVEVVGREAWGSEAGCFWEGVECFCGGVVESAAVDGECGVVILS